MKFGLLFRVESWWIGIHWSPCNRRFCINLVPMLTVWITLQGGIVPEHGNGLCHNNKTSKLKPCRQQYLYRLAQHYPYEL